MAIWQLRGTSFHPPLSLLSPASNQSLFICLTPPPAPLSLHLSPVPISLPYSWLWASSHAQFLNLDALPFLSLNPSAKLHPSCGTQNMRIWGTCLFTLCVFWCRDLKVTLFKDTNEMHQNWTKAVHFWDVLPSKAKLMLLCQGKGHDMLSPQCHQFVFHTSVSCSVSCSTQKRSVVKLSATCDFTFWLHSSSHTIN